MAKYDCKKIRDVQTLEVAKALDRLSLSSSWLPILGLAQAARDTKPTFHETQKQNTAS